MINTIKKLLGIGPSTDWKALIASGAQIIDVRTKAEYQQGHVKGSINIPLNNLPQQQTSIRKDKPVITCCASGMRSAQAKNLLKSSGFQDVYNGGSWIKVQQWVKG